MAGRKRRAGKDIQDAGRIKLIGAMNRCFSTEDGKRVLKYLGQLCAWAETSVGGKPDMGFDALTGTLYNEARRGVYVELRSFIRADILKEVEFHVETEEAPNTEDKE